MRFHKILITAALSLAGLAASAQSDTQIVIEPLFDYPTAPDTITNLHDRSDWLMDNFWAPMNLKEKSTVDQNALNHAFAVYVTPMQYADTDRVMRSVDRLIKSIEKNPTLSLQFAKAAEEGLYGPRAQFWQDDIFLRFVDNVLRNKQIKKERKPRYQRLRTMLGNTLTGTVPPEFDYTMPDGKRAHYSPNGVITIIEFGDPDCDDCRMAKLKLDTDLKLSELVDKGKVNIVFINADPDDGWEKKLADYPAKWHVGASDEISDIYDLRATPSLYVMDREGKIAVKNVDAATAINIATILASQIGGDR